MGTKALTKTQVSHIIYLRERGHSLPEIKRITRHGYGTVFKYIRDVKILPQFQEFWQKKRKSSIFRASQQQRKAQEEAKRLIRNIKKKDKIIITACLYWAEGAKRDINLTNTDPILIKTFVDGLKELGIGRESLSISLRLYEDINRKRACSFWSNVVGIPQKRIMYIDVLKGKKKGKLKYGMCRVRVIKGAYTLKLLNALRDIIGNNDSPRRSTDRTRVS